MVILGDYFRDKRNSRVCAKLIYSPSLRSTDRLNLHDTLSNEIDRLGGSGSTLGSALNSIFTEYRERGVVVEAINLAED
jgi:hypothetical protein